MNQNPNHVGYKKFQCYLNEKVARVKSKTAEGPNRKLKPKATPIKPNVFALFSGVDISASTVVAVATVPPLIPSISLAMKSKQIGKSEEVPNMK